MVKRSLEPNSFVRRLTLPAFTAIIGSNCQLEAFLQARRLSNFMRMSIDATGSILKQINGKKLLHHVLVTAIRVGIDKNCVNLNVLEMITEDQSAHNVCEFLEFFLRQLKSLNVPKSILDLPVHEMVMDKSFANIGPICKVFNKMTISQYLQICHDVLSDPENSQKVLKSLVIVRLCSSHTCKTMLDDIRKFYSKEHVITVCKLIGTIFNIKSYEEMITYVKSLLIILSWPNEEDEIIILSKQNISIAQTSDSEENDEFRHDDVETPESNEVRITF